MIADRASTFSPGEMTLLRCCREGTVRAAPGESVRAVACKGGGSK